MPRIISQEKIEMPKKVAVNVDDLLASVEKTSKKEVNAKVKVNANSLLSQVDGELEQTFRQKVINRIGKNYQEVKEALANRNQE
jgi:tellurite resistance protein